MSKKCPICRLRPVALYGKCKVCFFTGQKTDEEEEETEKEEGEEAEEDDVDEATPPIAVGQLDIVDEKMGQRLRNHGFYTTRDIQRGGRANLSAIPGVSNTFAARLLAEAGRMGLTMSLADQLRENEDSGREWLEMIDLRGVECEHDDCEEGANFWVTYRKRPGGNPKSEGYCKHHYGKEFTSGKKRLVDFYETKIDYLS